MKKINKITIALLLQLFIFQGLAFCEPAQELAPQKNIQLDFNDYNISDEQWLLLEKSYKSVTKEKNVIIALELLRASIGAYSRDAILGANLTNKPIKVQFKDLTQINPSFKDFDAAGSKVGSKLFININEKHKSAPPIALAALLAHEALHQDAFNSINEETYAWTMEAAVWAQISEKYPDKINLSYPLVQREDKLKKLFVKGNYTDEYIRKSILANPAYQNLPSRSPGFEDRL